MKNYKDMLAKAKFYKEKILQSFVKQSYFPTNDEINNALEDIDLRTSLLDTYISKPGSFFNTKEVNYMFECIYNDLAILYEVLEHILINEYNKLKIDVEAQIKELEVKAEEVSNRMKEEISSSISGTTIYYKSTNFNPKITDDLMVVDLEKIKFIKNSTIALFVEMNNIDASNVYFTFQSEDKNKGFTALPYNYNNNTYKIKDTSKLENLNDYNIYDLVIKGDVRVNDTVKIELGETNFNNKYKVLGGLNYISIIDAQTNNRDFISIPNINQMYTITNNSYIEFYMYNKDNDYAEVQYLFNEKPTHCNFSLEDTYINSTDIITKVYMEVPAGFSFGLNIYAGKVYCTCVDGQVVDNVNILCDNYWGLNDYLILEFIRNEVMEMDGKLIIQDNNASIEDLKSIYIKEVD